MPGWLLLGEVPGREVVFGAVGTFWKPDIEWHDLTAEQFAAFASRAGARSPATCWCGLTVPSRSVLSYECRTATTDPVSQAQMSRYWWLIRPFVAYVLRAVLRTIRGNAEARA